MCSGWCFSTNISTHPGGRIVIGWNPSCFTVDIVYVTSQLIHCKVTTGYGKYTFWRSFVYGFNDTQQRETLWKDLTDITLNRIGAWVCFGDFNALMNTDERIGNPVRWHDIRPMRECMHNFQLEDVKYVGNFFTWNNKQEGSGRVLSKIDRVVANQCLQDTFADAVVRFMPEGDFDHSPILISMYQSEQTNRSFRFYNKWCNSPLFHGVGEGSLVCSYSRLCNV